MAKEPTGSCRKIGGRWQCRSNPIDRSAPPTAKGEARRKNIVVTGRTKAEAQRRLQQKLSEFLGRTAALTSIETLGQLIEYWERDYAKPAEYDPNGVKVAGLRSWKGSRQRAKHLMAFFDTDPELRHIDYTACRRLRAKILSTPTRLCGASITTSPGTQRCNRLRQNAAHGTDHPFQGGARSVADANRLMERFRQILNFAVGEGLLITNPMTANKKAPLVLVADERTRERVITDEEEHLLLAEAARHSACPHGPIHPMHARPGYSAERTAVR